jgi:hypothetical protein
MNEATATETPYGRYITSEGWFVLNLDQALAVSNEHKGAASFPLEPREHPFSDFGAHVTVLRPGQPNALSRAHRSLHADRRRRAARATAVGLFPLPRRNAPRVRRRRLSAMRDPDDRGTPRRSSPVPRQPHRAAARRIRGHRDHQRRRGLRRMARRVSANTSAMAPSRPRLWPLTRELTAA